MGNALLADEMDPPGSDPKDLVMGQNKGQLREIAGSVTFHRPPTAAPPAADEHHPTTIFYTIKQRPTPLHN